MTFELVGLIKSVGYEGIWGIIFTESGILFGILLPGDTLLFTAGILARHGYFELWPLIIGCMVSAFLGNVVGYEIGKRYGLPFARKYARRFITEEQLDATNQFFTRHGLTTIVIARFVPLVRTIAPFLAGVIHMDYRKFLVHSAIGAIVWAGGLPLVGYYLGQYIPEGWMELLILPIVLIIFACIFWPYIANYMKRKKAAKLAAKQDRQDG